MMAISVQHYLVLAGLLFTLGLVGLVVRKNILVLFMCIEVLLNSVNLAFLAVARHYGTMDGHVVVFFVMAVAASEAAVGLAIVATLFRNRETVRTSDWRILNG